MKNYLIPEQFLLELLNYLAGRPLREVEPAVNALRNLQPAPDATGDAAKAAATPR